MTQEEKYLENEYGTAYPCCGNCVSIRRAGFKLICQKYYEYRDFDSVKCFNYEFKEYIPKLDELK